jgi:hypothetical protein
MFCERATYRLRMSSGLDENLVGRLLLLRLIEDVNAPSWLVGRERNIISPPPLMLIRELLNRRNVFLRQLNLLEVLRNPRWRNRLGNDGMATDLAPSQDDLCRCSALLLSDSLDFGTRDEQRNVEEVVAKRGVGGDVDVLLLGILNQLLAGQDGVALNLVDRRHKIGLLDQSFQSLVGEVGHTDRADLTLRQLVHGLPCLTVRDRVVNIDLVGIRRGREKVRMWVLAWTKVDRPVNEVEIKVVKLKLSKRVIKGGLNGGRIMLGIPELRGDEDVLTLQTGNVFEGTFDAFGDLFLVLVAVIGGKTR